MTHTYDADMGVRPRVVQCVAVCCSVLQCFVANYSDSEVDMGVSPVNLTR